MQNVRLGILLHPTITLVVSDALVALGYVGSGPLSIGIECLKESPPYKNDNDERKATNGSILCPVSLRYSRRDSALNSPASIATPN